MSTSSAAGEQHRVQVGLVASLYGEANEEVNSALLSAYEDFLDRHGEHLRTFLEDDTGRPRPFGPAERAYAARRLSKPGATVYARATGASDIKHASVWQIQADFTREDEGSSGMVWSVEPDLSSAALLDDVLALARRSRLLHGSAGRGVIAPIEFSAHRATAPTIIALARRFAGLDVVDLDTQAPQDGIRCVNWLTLIGDPILERIGGRAALERLPSDVVVHEVERAVVVQAGPTPLSGDSHHADELAPYRSVAEALRPAFAEGEDTSFNGLFTPDEDVSDAWRRRFFRGSKWP